MKVLMLAPGQLANSRRPVDWLLDAGVEVVFLDPRNPLPVGHRRFRYIPFPKTGVSLFRRSFGSRIGHAMGLWAVPPLRFIEGLVRPDIVHVYFVDHRAYHCVKAGMKPLVLSVTGTDVNMHFRPDADPEHRRVIGATLSAADLVMVDSSDLVDKCVELAQRPIAIELMMPGIDPAPFRPSRAGGAELRRELAIPPDTEVIFSPRALAPQYGHHAILDAFAAARPRLKRPAILVLKRFNHGDRRAAKAYERELRRRAGALGVLEAIRWVDDMAVAKLPGLYALADVVVNYPAMDAFPVTFLEAAASERPVITCRLPAYAGTFAEKFFEMVRLDDPDDLAERMVAVLNGPPPRAERLRAARRVVEEEYHASGSARRLVEIYRRVQKGG